MKTAAPDRTSSNTAARLTAMLCFSLAIQPTAAQLAITEVMSSALGGPDFWELTNFGDSPIDLKGYALNDRDGFTSWTLSTNLVILPHQAIIFAEQKTAAFTAQSFRQWWGLSPDVPVVLYTEHGLAASGDSVRLWSSTNATDEFLVDSIVFSQATQGYTFSYNPATDAFDELNGVGANGAFKAATSADVGSPGTPPVWVPMEIIAQPANTVANGGEMATLTVGKRGLPPPSLQWFHNLVPIPGARSASLTITNLQSEHEGEYRVMLSNFLGEVVRSATATLTVSLVPAPPRWLEVPAHLIVFTGQSPTLRSVATGVPQPSYQWYFNDVAIPGARQNSFTVYDAQFFNSGDYTVAARNTNGVVTNMVQLTVTPRPDLRVTEAMPSRSTNGVPGVKRDDWWELTSFETTASIDLFGYRFDEDGGANPHLAISWVNTNHVSIHPGESVIFVRNLTSAEFRDWWGPANLPVDLQILTYRGGGLGLDAFNDALFLWNPGATTDDDDLYAADWFEPAAPPGVSFTFDRIHTFVPCCDQMSVEGVDGAVAAEKGGDIGSPGYIRTPPEPRIKGMKWQPSGCQLTWRSIPGSNYTVRYKNALTAANWIPLPPLPLSATGTSMSYLDTSAAAMGQRFYRVFLEP